MLQRIDPFFDRSRQPARRAFLDADVYRRGDTFYLELDVPGVDIEDIDIEVEKMHLTVRVERREIVDEERTDIMRGRPTGRFVRRFFLGDGLDGENIEASLAGGVLKLGIPVKETAKARRIAVTTGSS